MVIAIIAILAAMLLPALAKAKLKAEQATDASNLHQLYLSLMMYAQDYSGWFPWANETNSKGEPWYVNATYFPGPSSTDTCARALNLLVGHYILPPFSTYGQDVWNQDVPYNATWAEKQGADYVGNIKLFVPPTSASNGDPNGIVVSAVPWNYFAAGGLYQCENNPFDNESCGYDYAEGFSTLNQNIPDIALMADEKFLDWNAPSNWDIYLISSLEHFSNGVNVLYINGNVKFLAANPITPINVWANWTPDEEISRSAIANLPNSWQNNSYPGPWPQTLPLLRPDQW